jgi:hypothetical protein
MRKPGLLPALLILLISCKKEQPLKFSEYSFIYDNHAFVEINIPTADSLSIIGNRINQAVENQISNALNIDDKVVIMSLPKAIENFDYNYSSFKDDLDEESLRWEASFDGEIMYESPSIISIGLSSFLNTGGAHSSINISFFNFDSESGNILSIQDIISDLKGFTLLAKGYFQKAIENKESHAISDYFFGDEFKLPENIGFSEEGLVLIYNVYEIAYFDGSIMEFTIPFEEVEDYLNSNLDIL